MPRIALLAGLLVVACGSPVDNPDGSSEPPPPSDGGTPDSAEAGTPSVRVPPAGAIVWDWQIGASTEASVAPPPGARLLDVDLFELSASAVASLKSKSIYTVCYLNAGSWQPGLPDSNQYPDYLKLQQDPDWPGEYFLDITDVFKPDSALARILRARLALCKSKGFDGVEPDNLQNDENVSGGRITRQEQIDFNGWIADAAHAAGLGVLQKNGPDKILVSDRTGRLLVDKFDGILNEECQAYDECPPLAEYVKRGKLALNVEYTGALDCNLSHALNINSIKKDLGLVGAQDRGYAYAACP